MADDFASIDRGTAPPSSAGPYGSSTDGASPGAAAGATGGAASAAASEATAEATATGAIAQMVLGFVGRVPTTDEHLHRSPDGRARRIGRLAAARAAFASGSLSLPPGVLGWLTLLPELKAVWDQQAQMVADIAGAYGRYPELSREVMLYCLFRHIAPSAFRGLVRREGDVHVVGRASAPVFGAIAAKIAARVTLRLVGRGASRWLPVVGAVGNGGLAWFDTGRVAATAIDVFSRPLVVAGGTRRRPAA